MGKFLSSLAKGFARSAVNQVGRDGGRVISNQVYGNRNYTPVGVVNPNSHQARSSLNQIKDPSPIHTEKPISDIGIEEILSSDGFQKIIVEGKEVESKKLDLSAAPLMGMFDNLMVSRFNDGTVYLDFRSKKYAPNKELSDFIARCTRKWGPDSNGKGLPSPQDLKLLENGQFGRHWNTVKIVQLKNEGDLSATITMRIIIPNNDIVEFANNIQQTSVPANAVLQQTSFPVVPTVLLVFLGLVFPLGGIFALIYGFNRYRKNTLKATWMSREVTRTPDRRHRTGYRASSVAVKQSGKVPADDIAISQFKKQGQIIMIIGVVLLIFGVVMLNIQGVAK